MILKVEVKFERPQGLPDMIVTVDPKHGIICTSGQLKLYPVELKFLSEIFTTVSGFKDHFPSSKVKLENPIYGVDKPDFRE